MGKDMELRRVGDVAVHVIGSGPPVVLLHPNGGSHRDFDAIIDVLAERTRVHAIDWPGHGASGPATDPGACTFADALPAILEALDIGPCTLIGSSVGGFAAIRTAARRPDLVKDVVLIDPGGFTPRTPLLFLACGLFGSRAVAPSAMRLLPRISLRRRTPTVQRIRAAAAASSRDPENVRVFAGVWRSFTEREHDARSDAARIRVPVLLVWGTRDPILPWAIDGRRARRALPAARVVRLPCGHQAFAEMPAEFLAVLWEFLDRDAVARP